MRQVLPMKPLASAMRYGPFFLVHWKNLVCAVQGLKHSGSALGPLTILGPCCAPAGPERAGQTSAAATTAAMSGMVRLDISPSSSFLLIFRALRRCDRPSKARKIRKKEIGRAHV